LLVPGRAQVAERAIDLDAGRDARDRIGEVDGQP
jgi:hypothetical protein